MLQLLSSLGSSQLIQKTTNTLLLLKTFFTTLASCHDSCLAWKTWVVQPWTLLELVLEVARGEGQLDQGGLRVDGDAVACLDALLS